MVCSGKKKTQETPEKEIPVLPKEKFVSVWIHCMLGFYFFGQVWSLYLKTFLPQPSDSTSSLVFQGFPSERPPGNKDSRIVVNSSGVRSDEMEEAEPIS